jgi:hypothetical protein
LRFGIGFYLDQWARIAGGLNEDRGLLAVFLPAALDNAAILR